MYYLFIFFFSVNLKGQAQTPERKNNVTPFVTAYYVIIDDKSSMQTVKYMFKNIKNEHFKSICKDASSILPL